ncbi:MAG: cyclic nucleotide-binding domain-containing protein, partial [Polyangiaceae bacterium]|nr:cyclic nucleotide-binding domain-containing protein [Polyangiaceae bacterium]
MFESLGDEDLAELASALRERRLLPGDMVFREGDGGSAMYVVSQGEVSIFLSGERGARVELTVFEEGDYFGEMALFDDKPRSASAQAASTTVLLELRRGTVEAYLEKKPGAAMSILKTVAERLRETNAMLSERAARNAIEEYERGRSWRDRLADRVARLNGSWTFILSLMTIIVVWAVFNLPGILVGRPPDPYPYIFFNLLLAVLVALQWPLIVMSQNRQAAKVRQEAEHDFMINLKNET